MIAAFAKALLGASSWRILHKEQSVWKAARCMRAKSFYIMLLIRFNAAAAKLKCHP